MNHLLLTALLLVATVACSDSPSKDGDPTDASRDTAGSDASSPDLARPDGGRAGVGEPCVNGGLECEPGLLCQSNEETRWNFCGAPMEPNCDDGFVGDSCGNCFQACQALDECPAEMTCNGTFCISGRTCREEQPLPP